MSLRIDTNMSMLKTQDMTAERARDNRAQGVNPAAQQQETDKLREQERTRPPATEEAEFNRVDVNREREESGTDSEDEGEAPIDDAPPLDEEARRLRELASERLLELPVEKGRFAVREEHRIDIRL